jgi:hypothetical protein
MQRWTDQLWFGTDRRREASVELLRTERQSSWIGPEAVTSVDAFWSPRLISDECAA